MWVMLVIRGGGQKATADKDESCDDKHHPGTNTEQYAGDGPEPEHGQLDSQQLSASN